MEGNADKKTVYSHEKFVEPMLKYIVNDFERRISMNENSGMVVDTVDQAKKMYEIFQSMYANETDSNKKIVLRKKSK